MAFYHEMADRFFCLQHLTPIGSNALRNTPKALVCCPHAGGSASYFRPWVKDMPKDIALFGVEYAGHGERINEQCHTTIEELLDDLMPAFIGFGQRPYVLFGHSMGAVIVFELCCRLESIGFGPCGVILSSHQPVDEPVTSNLHCRDDHLLWQDTIRVGGTTAEILKHTELIQLLTPVLRSDYQLIEQYRLGMPKKINTPVSIFCGDDDPDLPISIMEGWQKFCIQPITVHLKSGGHFYLNHHYPSLIDTAVELLDRKLSYSLG